MTAAGARSAAYTQSELEAMTKAQLLEVAAELGVSGVSGSTLKADIISAILAVTA